MLTLGDVLSVALTALMILISIASIWRRNGNGSTASDASLMSGSWRALVQEQRREIAILRELAAMRGAQLERARIEPATYTAAESIYDTMRDLAEQFSIDELDTLMLAIDLRPDSIRGDTIDERARELVLAADRRGKLAALVQAANEARS